MKNEVYGTVTLDVSVDVESNNEEMGLIEAKHKYDDYRLLDCWVYVMDRDGNVHKLNVHNFKINLCEFMD